MNFRDTAELIMSIEGADWMEDVDRDILEPVLEADDGDLPYLGDMRRSFALLPIYMTKKVIERDPSRVQSLTKDELIDRIPMFVSRRNFYSWNWNEWMESLDRNEDDPYQTAETAFHLFAPIYVQELEGPVRYNLAALIDIIQTFLTGEGDWHQQLYDGGRKQYFHELLDPAINAARRVEEEGEIDHLRVGLQLLARDEEVMDSEQFDLDYLPSLREVRNAIAHADYVFEQRHDGETEVVLFLNGEKVRRPVRGFPRMFHSHLFLVLALTLGVAAACFWAAVHNDRLEKAFKITSAAEWNYPDDVSDLVRR